MDDPPPAPKLLSVHPNPPNLQVFTHILPLLSPPDLASFASTCKNLTLIAKRITTLRSNDAARGLEPHPIPFTNSADDQPYSYFLYTPYNLIGPPNPIQPQAWGVDFSQTCQRGQIGQRGVECGDGGGGGCECEGECGEGCSCNLGFGFGVRWECGGGCGCVKEEELCGNRVSQRGVGVRLRIGKEGDGRKGWGLYAAEEIQCGAFVCQYAGECKSVSVALECERLGIVIQQSCTLCGTDDCFRCLAKCGVVNQK